jgi:NADH-quinone oxidoreductase subunit C
MSMPEEPKTPSPASGGSENAEAPAQPSGRQLSAPSSLSGESQILDEKTATQSTDKSAVAETEKPVAVEATPPAEQKATPSTRPTPPPKPATPKPAAPAAKKPAGPTYNEIRDDPIIKKLKAQFGEAVQEAVELLGDQIIRLRRDQAHEILRFLRDDPEAQFDFLTDLTAVHYPEKEQQFEIVYHLYSFPRNVRLRVKVAVADGESVESATDLWSTANWMEREVYDLFGVHFDHHPDLRRILLPPDWTGHPLRKEHYLEYQENDWVRRHLEIREVHPETDLTGKYEMTEFVRANR